MSELGYLLSQQGPAAFARELVQGSVGASVFELYHVSYY